MKILGCPPMWLLRWARSLSWAGLIVTHETYGLNHYREDGMRVYGFQRFENGEIISAWWIGWRAPWRRRHFGDIL